MSAELKAGVEVADITTSVKEERTYPYDTEELSFTREILGYSAFYEWRMDPQSPWDPRVYLSFGNPWRSGIKASASFPRDLVVLVGELGFQSREEGPHSWFTAALAAGFVANSWIRLAVSANLAVPVRGVGFPLESMGLKIIYAFDPEEKRSIGIHIGASLGEQTSLSVEVYGQWRGP